MIDLLQIVLPVFVVVGVGYLATKLGYMKDEGNDVLTSFAQNIAIPCLLFLAIWRLDLAAGFDLRILTAYYLPVTFVFVVGAVLARYVFGRPPGEAVAVGFCAFFANTVLLGLPISERAYGVESLSTNYAIVALNAPWCYFLGITAMEFVRADGRSASATFRIVIKAMFKNALMIALAFGLLANVTGLALPEPIVASLEMLARASLPVALFALGGILTRYKMQAELPEVGMVGVLSLVISPVMSYWLAVHFFALEPVVTRSLVLTAAMAPGVNAYIFSTMYNRATGLAATSVLLLTAASVVSASVWLWVLEGV